MVQFRPQAKEIIAKIVYYGPPLGGKTTNLRTLYKGYPPDIRGELVVVPAGGDRTIFFDFLPLDAGTLRNMKLRVQLYTVPGQVHYNATRQIVLRGVDAVVFVADSQRELTRSNRDSFEDLKNNLLLQGHQLSELPHVLQFNKRDIKDVMGVEELNSMLNEFNVPFFEAVATVGIGVEETLQGVVKLVARSLRQRFNLTLDSASELADVAATISQTRGAQAPRQDAKVVRFTPPAEQPPSPPLRSLEATPSARISVEPETPDASPVGSLDEQMPFEMLEEKLGVTHKIRLGEPGDELGLGPPPSQSPEEPAPGLEASPFTAVAEAAPAPPDGEAFLLEEPAPVAAVMTLETIGEEGGFAFDAAPEAAPEVAAEPPREVVREPADGPAFPPAAPQEAEVEPAAEAPFAAREPETAGPEPPLEVAGAVDETPLPLDGITAAPGELPWPGRTPAGEPTPLDEAPEPAPAIVEEPAAFADVPARPAAPGAELFDPFAAEAPVQPAEEFDVFGVPVEAQTPALEAEAAPVEAIALPVEAHEEAVPVEEAATPFDAPAAEAEAAPVELIAPPVEGPEEAAPVEEAAVPFAAPVDVAEEAPAELVAPPEEALGEAAPVEEVAVPFAAPADESEAAPADLVAAPEEGLGEAAPVEEVAVPFAVPADEAAAAPVDLVAPPEEGLGEAAPVEEAAAPFAVPADEIEAAPAEPGAFDEVAPIDEVAVPFAAPADEAEAAPTEPAAAPPEAFDEVVPVEEAAAPFAAPAVALEQAAPWSEVAPAIEPSPEELATAPETAAPEPEQTVAEPVEEVVVPVTASIAEPEASWVEAAPAPGPPESVAAAEATEGVAEAAPEVTVVEEEETPHAPTVEAVALQRAVGRAITTVGEVRELEVEVPVPAVWTGGRRMTLQLRLTLVPQEDKDDG